MLENKDNDISLKELVLRIRGYIFLLLSKWKTILSCGLIFLFLGAFLFVGSPKSYTAKLSFMLNVDERGINSGLAALLGQYALGLSAGESNPEKILELSRSRTIAELALFDTIVLNGKTENLANHFIEAFESIGAWDGSGFLSLSKDSLSLEGFRFKKTDPSQFNALENKALKRVHAMLTGEEGFDAILKTDYNDVSGIMSLSVSCPNENLAIRTSEMLFEALSFYYIEKSTEKQQYEYDILKEKYDSINNVLSDVQFRLAAFEDTNKALYRKQDMLLKDRLEIDEQKLLYMLGKAEEQVQLAKITLDNKTPYVQLIDKPIGPLEPDNMPLAISLLLSFIIGLILASILIVLHQVYKEIINAS